MEDYNKFYDAYKQGLCYRMSFESFLTTITPKTDKEQKELENAYQYYLNLQPAANVFCKY